MINTCDIEFAHHEVAARADPLARAEIEQSSWIASALWAALPDVSCSTSVLVDDKDGSYAGDAVEALAGVEPYLLGIRVDRLLLETALENLTLPFVSLIESPSDQRRIQNSLARYKRSHGYLACSQDIAIWYSLRRGDFTRIERNRILDSAQINFRLGAWNSDLLVSVLPTRFREFEERAQSDLLSHMRQVPAVSHIYFDAQDSERTLMKSVVRVAGLVEQSAQS